MSFKGGLSSIRHQRVGSRPDDKDIVDFIRTNLPLTRLPTMPEIALHRAGPASGLWRLAASDPAGFGSPYWAYPWPGGLALARHVLDQPEVVSGRRVLDLGTGGGLVAIACAKAGAREVLAADIDPYALAAMSLNATANGVSFMTVGEDLTNGAPPPVDLILVGDLFYAPRLAAKVTAFLDRSLAMDIEVLLGDIGRADLPLHRLRRLAAYPVPEVGEAAGASKLGGVYAFERSQV